jgi:hypothetical protein
VGPEACNEQVSGAFCNGSGTLPPAQITVEVTGNVPKTIPSSLRHLQSMLVILLSAIALAPTVAWPGEKETGSGFRLTRLYFN